MTNEAINQPKYFILESELPVNRATYLNDFFEYIKKAFEGVKNIQLASEEIFFDPDNNFYNTKFSFAISDKKTNNQMSIFIDNDNQIFLIDSFGSKFMGISSSNLSNFDFENILDRISLKRYDSENGTHLFITKDLDGNNIEAPKDIESILVKTDDQIEEKLKVTLYIINGQISYAVKYGTLKYISPNQTLELNEEEFNQICKDCDIDFNVYVKGTDGSISRYKRTINNGFSNNDFSNFVKSYSTTAGTSFLGNHLYEISAVSSFLVFLGIYYFPTIKNFISGPAAAPQIMPAPQQQGSPAATNQAPQRSPSDNKREKLENLLNKNKDSSNNGAITTTPRIAKSISTQTTPTTTQNQNTNDRGKPSLNSIKNKLLFQDCTNDQIGHSPSPTSSTSNSAIQPPQDNLGATTSSQIPSTPAMTNNLQVEKTTKKTVRKLIEQEAPSMQTRARTDARDQRLLDLNDKKARENNPPKTAKKTGKKTAKKTKQPDEFNYNDDNMLSIATTTPYSPISSHVPQVTEITVTSNQLRTTSSTHDTIGFNPETNKIVSYKEGAKGSENIIKLDTDALRRGDSLNIQGFKLTLDNSNIDSEFYQDHNNKEARISLTSKYPDNQRRIEKFNKIASESYIKTAETMVANGKIESIDIFQRSFPDTLSDSQVKEKLKDKYGLNDNEVDTIMAAQQNRLTKSTKGTKKVGELKSILIKAQNTLNGGVPLWAGFTLAMIARVEASSIKKIYIDNEEILQDECIKIFDKDENNFTEICGIDAYLIKQSDAINSVREDYQHSQNVKKVSYLTAQSLVCNFITPMITRNLAESNKLSLVVYGSELPKIVSSAAATGTCNYVFETSANIISYELVKDITCSSVFIATSIYLPIPGINYLAGSIAQKSCDLTFNYFETREFSALALPSAKSAVIITGCGIISSQVVANNLDDPTISSSAALTTNQLCSKTAPSLYDYVYSLYTFIFGETDNPAISSEHS